MAMALAGAAVARGAEGAVVWQVDATAQPTDFDPAVPEGSQGYYLVAANVGAVEARGPITMSVRLPLGLSAAPVKEGCEVQGRLVSCVFEEAVPSGRHLAEFIPVTVDPSAVGASLEAVVTVEGGGGEASESSVGTSVGSPPPEPGFLPGAAGLAGLISEPGGAPAARAGSTPFQVTFGMGFPSVWSRSLTNARHPRDIAVELPAGMVVDPAATPRCRERQLELEQCPPGSQVGTIDVITALSPITLESGKLYNVVPPPGSASNFAFKVKSTGSVFRLLGSLRTDDFGLSAAAPDVLAKYAVLGIRVHLWGYPADPAHDAARGGAAAAGPTPLITMPSACGPLVLAARTDSWEEPGAFFTRTAQASNNAGVPFEVEGCSRLGFEPTLSAQPTTAAADSASGLALKVAVPQRLEPEGSSDSSLRRATLTLPAGVTLNPAAAVGLAACSPAQAGLLTPVGQGKPEFDGAPATCPDASKLGTVSATTPLVADESEVGGQAVHPLTGSIFLAQPEQNPFGSEFAIYAVVEEPERGIILKLAGKVVPDPASGRLTATIDGLPQLPFEEFRLEFFGGAGAPLRTPALCGTYSSQALMTAWSGAPQVQAESRFSIGFVPSGGSCPTASAQLPNSPAFTAGSVSPAAGRYSTFVLDLARGDGSQEIAGLDLSLPAGLVGRLAGSATCSDAALAAAAARSGAAEMADPSCPAASRLGRASIGVGAGSSLYTAAGNVYLAGPYRGAPLSLAVVTPATAGPFDFGTVVVRAQVLVDPRTGAVSVRSDRLPSMIEGVPLDIRSLVLELDKPELIRNPTSCDRGAVEGEAIFTSGTVAELSSRFQVGNCGGLRFRPKLSFRVSGALGRNGHPAVRATFRTDAGGAALKSATFTLPPAELLDLRHVRELCPRWLPVGQCPRGSRLGSLRVSTPLLEDPLEGPVYLRVPARRLPGLSADLRAGDLRFELSGRTTAARGRFGVRLGPLPDIPLSRAVLTLPGGRRGILVNSRNLCRGRSSLAAGFSAQNGIAKRLEARVGVAGCKRG